MTTTAHHPDQLDNLHVRELTPLLSPYELKTQLPMPEAAARTVAGARATIRRILRGEDQRLMVVIGPCSIHDTEAAMDYARRLRTLAGEVDDRLFILMRAYLEKPRTTVGWRGLINDPYLDGSFDMSAGLKVARRLLIDMNALGLPVATEMLDPISPQYLDDQISLATIGARTTEAQTHRALASGVSMPVGFKNGTDGGIQVAVNGCLTAAGSHSFLGIDEQGHSAVVKTTGNPDAFVILRGGRGGPNYSASYVAEAADLMQKANLRPAVMIDCSHANTGSDYRLQEGVWNNVLAQVVGQHEPIVGLMVESNIFEGKQQLTADHSALRYGVSLTDGCIGWEQTERILHEAHAALARG
ncbi:phospho-2-dehydro-3-deoxyheptonate aldolase [Kouleothrix aurantiaca]|jgi:3-deoxy-7-phosphoheptulonate synthase|uniref:Phospho-2-dehydro-3-deoxyheptonate aldolase n=1 Tax=Kouleothrix aurantiaca TaxID=186479 RepID=A0A0P9F2H2_9CHLR|nr:phospho-2-dehydro-3-deoxyheptonate aldolase [Kouleothrix aurantiaca]